jgi:NAD(P)H-nitrite reductase large subunit
MEKPLWTAWAPRNCAEATRKNWGVVCGAAGYQIGVCSVAGNYFKRVERPTDVSIKTEVSTWSGPFSRSPRAL